VIGCEKAGDDGAAVIAYLKAMAGDQSAWLASLIASLMTPVRSVRMRLVGVMVLALRRVNQNEYEIPTRPMTSSRLLKP